MPKYGWQKSNMAYLFQLFLGFLKKNLSNDRTKIFSQCKIENKHNQWIPCRLYPSLKQRQTVANSKFTNRNIAINPFYFLAQNKLALEICVPLNAKLKTVCMSAPEKNGMNFKTRLLNVHVYIYMSVCVHICWTLLFQDTWTEHFLPLLSPKSFMSHMHRFRYVSMQLLQAADISLVFLLEPHCI